MDVQSQNKTKKSEKLLNNTNNRIVLQNVQNTLTAKGKKYLTEYVCRRVTRSQVKAGNLNFLNNNYKCTILQNIQNTVTTKAKQWVKEYECRRITRSQSKTKCSKELLNDTNNIKKPQNTHNILAMETEYPCRRITRSQSKTKFTEELLNDNNNSTMPQNTQDILTTKVKKRVAEYRCKYPGCSAIYDRPFRLERHIRLHTGERPYKCDHPGCDKRYISFTHLKRHAETHDRVHKGLQCNQCSIIVSNYHNLTRHYKRVHANPLRCKECLAQFKKKHHLALHMDRHLGITTYKCSQCNKMFDTLRKLKHHETFHEGKGYHCPVQECCQVFDKWSLLRKHRVQHNVHKCKICGKEYKRNATLRLHLKIHTGHISLPCPYDTCNRIYIHKYSLKNHIRARHLDHKFVCDICKTKYIAKHTLRTHIMARHLGIIKVKKQKPTKSKRKKRKDAGIPRKSMVTILAGLKFVKDVDKELLKRESTT